MTTSSSTFYIWVLCTSLLYPTCCQSSLYLSSNHVAFFIFGDSLFDPTGRFTDGRIIPDFLAEYANLPLVLPYLQPDNHQFTNGVNFASGGAGALVETYPGQVVDLNTQLVYFKNVVKQLKQKLGDAETKTLLSKAIYFFGIGVNDYLIPFVANSTMLEIYTKKEYAGMVIGNLTTVFTEIHRIGGRKFLSSNMPPLSRLPSSTTLKPDDIKELKVLTKLHNKALPKLLEELEKQLKGFKYSFFDIHAAMGARIGNPSKYGFKENTACCGSGPYRGIMNCGVGKYELCENPNEYLFFDSGHSCDKAYGQFAKQIWDGSSNVIRSHSFKTLLGTYIGQL